MADSITNPRNEDRPIDLSFATPNKNSTKKDKPIDLSMGISSTPSGESLSRFNFQNVDRYKRFIDEIYPSVNLERQAAANQSGWGKFGNMLSQGVLGEILAQGVIGGAGSLIALPGALMDEIRGKDAEFSNFMTKFADNVSEELRDKSPIFRYNPDKAFDWKDWGWWTSNGVSIFSTLGLFIPALGEAKLAGYLSKALKGVSDISKINKVAGLRKSFVAASDIFNTEKYWQQLTHSAFAMRNAENIRESSQAFTTVRDEAFKLFQDDEEFNKVLNSEVGQEFLEDGGTPDKLSLANHIASKSAWKNYGMNSLNVMFDAVQLAPIFKGFKVQTRTPKWSTSAKVKYAEQLAVNPNAVKPHFNASSLFIGGSVVVGEQLSEGAEELINAISQSDSNWYGKHLLGKEKDKDFNTRLREYLQDPTSWEQAFWGVAGGVAFSAASRKIGSIKEAINDVKNPHNTKARIEEINNRYIKLAHFGTEVKKVQEGINPNTGEGFIGDENDIKEAQVDMVDRKKTELAYDLGFNAAKHGNIDALLEMTSHPDFKAKMISFGISSEDSFDSDLAKLKQDILDAEHTYKATYNKIFTATSEKPYLRNILINMAVNKKAELKQNTKLREKARVKAADLKANNPAFEALKKDEANKDKDFDGTLDNLINAEVIKYFESEIDSWGDESAQKVAKEKLKAFKDEFKLKDKDLGENKAFIDFNSISDIIKAEAEAKIFDLFLNIDNTLYEEILNTNKSIPSVENTINTALNQEYEKQLETFRSKISELTKVQFKIDNSTTMDSKIKTIDDMLAKLEKDGLDPFVVEDKASKKLTKERVAVYKDILEKRRTVLSNQKANMLIDENSVVANELKNQELVDNLNKALKNIGVSGVTAKYTGKRHMGASALIAKQVNQYVLDPTSGSPYARLIELIANDKEYTSDEKEDLKNYLNNEFSNLTSNNLIEEVINELLIQAGYITNTIPVPPNNPGNKHIDNIENFKNALGNEDIKPVVDFTSQNPINKNIVVIANKLITDIINDGEKPLFNESPEHGTFFKFEAIAAKYGSLVGAERLREDFEFLKRAYTIVRYSKINPETSQKRIYNSDATLKKITAEAIIEAYGINDETRDPKITDNKSVNPTGGEDVLNLFIPKIETALNNDGDQVVSDKHLDSAKTLLTSLAENDQVFVHINTKFSGQQGFSQNKNNENSVPISVEVEKDNKRVFVGAVQTMNGIHEGVKYNFNGKDWTDIIIDDSRTNNLKLEHLNRLFPLIQAYFNAKRMNESKTSISRAYLELLDADVQGLLNDLIGRTIDIKSEEGMKAVTHIARVLFFGQNTDTATPIEFKRTEIVANLIRWKDKLTRDYVNAGRIRKELGTDVDKTIPSSVKYITNGTLVKSKNSDGTVKYRNLSVIDDPSKVQLFTTVNNSQNTMVENTRNHSETVVKKIGTKSTYSNSVFVGVKGRDGKTMVSPLRFNTLNGKYLSVNKNLLNKVSELVIELGNQKKLGAAATKLKDLATTEFHHKKVDEIRTKINEIFNIDFSNQNHTNALIVSEYDIRFKINDTFYVYNYYQNSFRTERSSDNTKIEKPIQKEEFLDRLGSLPTSPKFELFGGKPYTDITGIRNNSYEEFLINNNLLVTDIGQLVDSKGNKISNFTLSQYDGVGGTPIAVNIDTSHLKSIVPKTVSFAKFINEYKLDRKYDFIFAILDQFISAGKISFNGDLKSSKIDPGTKKPMLLYYDPNNKSINVTKDWLDIYKNNPVDATLLFVHDALHSIIGTRSKEEQKQLLDNLTTFKKELLATEEYKALIEKKDKTEAENKIITILNIQDVEELLTYGLTDKEFATFLDSIKSIDAKVTQTFWGRLKEIIRELAKTFGIGTKLDELNYVFEQFITNGEIKSTTVSKVDKEVLGDVQKDEFDEFLDGDEFEEPKPVVSFNKNSPTINKDQVNYIFKATEILQSEKAKQIFEKGAKVGWDLNKILTELQVPKDQKELLLGLEVTDRENLILELNNRYGFVIESKIAKEKVIRKTRTWYENEQRFEEELPITEIEEEGTRVAYYSNLTVPGGTNYTENEISTPTIIPSIKGHAQFSTENGIGWFRSDEQGNPLPNKELSHSTEEFVYDDIKYHRFLEPFEGGSEWKFFKDNSPITRFEFENRYDDYYKSLASIKNTTRRILELQSDLFQKGRNKDFLPKHLDNWKDESELEPIIKQNQFLQLLNKDNNWVTFFVKTILQDSHKKGYEKVLFPSGETAAKIEGHQTIADEIKSIDKDIELLIARKLFVDNNGTEYYQRLTSNNEIKYSARDNEGNVYDLSKEIWTEKIIPLFDDEIKNLQKRRSELKTQGIEKLKPIEAFYTNIITNILKKIGKFETITDEYGNTWNKVNLEDVKSQVEPIKAVSLTSVQVNKHLTGSPFELDEEVNILNVLSNLFIEEVASKYQGIKGKNVNKFEIRESLFKSLVAQCKLRAETGNMTRQQADLLKRVIIEVRDNDKFWKLFKIHLSNEFNYNINEEEDFLEDIELLEKSWEQSDVVTKNPLSTINDQVKNLINRTYEVDPNTSIIENGQRVWRTNTNTPTGFANTISYSRYGNKIIDLMRGCLTKEDMLEALLKYATNANTVFAKTLFSIHRELTNNPDLLNAWYTSFDKVIVDSYRDLSRTLYGEQGELTELSLVHGNKNAVEYRIANEWTNLIVSRGENGFYNEEWIKDYDKLYNETATLSSNFTKINPEIIANIISLFNKVGIEMNSETIRFEFNEKQDIITNIISPLRNIKGIPGAKYTKEERIPYIDRLQKFPKTSFNEFGNLLRLADKVKYFREDHFTFSNINVTGNMVFDANLPSFLSNFFKKLEGGNESVFNALLPYTNILSNQHSLLLWGDQYIDEELAVQGRGILDYIVKDNVRVPIRVNEKNLANFKTFGYEGGKNLNENYSSEYSQLSKQDWTLKTLIYYFGGGKVNTKKEVTERLTAIFPMLNPSDRKNTRLFEAPVVEISIQDYIKLIEARNNSTSDIQASLDQVRQIPIFKAIYLSAVDELIAMNTAKELLFELNNGRASFEVNEDGSFGFKLKKEFQDNNGSAQLFYHYKSVDGQKRYLTFNRAEDGTYFFDKKNSGNIFDLNNITLMIGNEQISFNNTFIGETNFVKHLMLSDSLRTALYTPVVLGDEKSTFNNKLEQFVFRFINEQINNANEKLSVYEDAIKNTYIKRENVGKEDRTFILKGKQFNNAIAEFVLNTYLFNVEQVRLFYGSVADYKSAIDLNKRGGQIVGKGIPSVHKGIYFGATISDVKIKSKIYDKMLDTVIYSLNVDKKSIVRKKFYKTYSPKELATNTVVVNGKPQRLFKVDKEGYSVEREIYDMVSPYLSNDSANAVSLITFDEFEKRIKGFGLAEQYRNIINKVRNGEVLNREDTIRFASMQKNFYYSLDYNEKLQKMVPTQVKNAEIVLTPALIKDLQLETLNKTMKKLNLVQVNLESAEKIGSYYIANVADEEGNLTDEATLTTELEKARRSYNYEGLHMQLEVPNSLYEESITMSRQFAKKIIENIPDSTVEYNVNGKNLKGTELKEHYFKLLNSNVFEDACRTLLPFDVRVDKDGNIIGDVDYGKVIDILEKEGIDRNLTKNALFSIQIGESDAVAGMSRLPIFFNTHSTKWENILTGLFTNGVTNQQFPGLKAAQMSSLFINKKDSAVKLKDLTSLNGINFHASIGIKINTRGEVTNRKDIKLRSNVLFDDKENAQIIEAEVLLPRWASEFYKDGQYVDINEIPDEVRTMIGYRIPMEAKYSAYVFKVVGFLPDDNGPSIVLPDEFVTQTGSDFDMDTVYAFTYNIHNKYVPVTSENATGEDVVFGEKTKVEIKRIEYIDGTSKADIEARVDAIMEDKPQLVHVLSLGLDNEQLTNTIEKLNNLIIEYFDSKDLQSDENKIRFAKQFAQIESIKKRIKKVKAKERKDLYLEINAIFAPIALSSRYFKEREEYSQIKDLVRDIISDLDVIEQNTKKARENQILDIYYSILTNPYHYPEIIATSNFRDISNVKQKIDEKLNIANQDVNNLTQEGQLHYREKSQQGRNLKGISIASDRFNSVSQIAGIHLTEKLKKDDKTINKNVTLPIVAYPVTPKQKKDLIENYGDDVKFEMRGKQEYAVVTHRFIGNNPKNTFKNVVGKLINSYSAQTTANILDNVAFPLPNNVNSYTINIWKLLVSLGSTYEISTALINQPIIRELTDTFFSNISGVKRGSEIEAIKRKFQTLLYIVKKQNGQKANTYTERWDKQIADNKLIWVNTGKYGKEQYKILGYSNNVGTILSEKELFDNMNFVNITADPKTNMPTINELATASPERLAEIEQHLLYQLKILETFKHIKTYSDAVTDGTRILNTDKIGAGPTFDVTHKLIYDIERSHNQGILEINNVSAMPQIFPKHFNLERTSAYPTMEQFLVFSNLLSFKAFGQFFIGQSELYREIKKRLNSYTTDKTYDVKLAERITNYLNNSLLKDLPWLNDISIDEKRTILGIDTELNFDLDLSDPNSLTEFEQLSLANQIVLLKYHLATQNSNNPNFLETHLLNHLKTSTKETEIDRNGYHKVDYLNNDIPDHMTQSFNNMWYSDNIFERIVARNLIKYEYTTNGFGFGFTSFSKIIPNNIFYYQNDPFIEGSYNEMGIGLSAHLYEKLRKTNSLVFSKDYPDEEVDLASQIIFNSNYKERFIKANWRDDNIVPDASGLKNNQVSYTTSEGEIIHPRYFQTMRDENNVDTGIISIPVKTLDNIPAGKIANKVKDRTIIKLSFTNLTTGEVKFQLFQRFDNYITVDEEGHRGGTVYYYPINKLEFSENEEVSVFPENSLYVDGSEIQSPNDYEGIIEKIAKQRKLEEVIFPVELAMNMTTADGEFRDELQGFTSTLELIRNGFRTATTRKDSTGEAQKWEPLQVGNYVKLQGTDEYIKVTKPLTKLDLSTRAAREEWSQKEGWSRSYLNKIEDGIAFGSRTDLWQFEYTYIGKIDDVRKDSNFELDEEGEVDEDVTSTNESTESTNMSSLREGDRITIIVSGRRTSQDKFDIIKIFKGEDGLYSLTVRGTKTNTIYNYEADEEGIIDYHSDEVLAYIDFNTSNLKPVLYTSSTNKSVNAAINSATAFIEKHTGTYANRIKVLKKVGTLKDSLAALTDADFKKLIEENDLATIAKGLRTILIQYDFDLNTPKTETKKGGLIARVKDFENLDMNEIVNDPILRRDFIELVRRASSFFKGVTSFTELTSTDNTDVSEGEKVINDVIRQIQALSPVIENLKSKIDKLFEEFEATDLIKYTKNPEIVAGTRKIFDTGDDENYFQLKLDSLADTNNAYIALMIKKYTVNMINADDDANKEIGELEAILRKTSGKNITTLTAADFDKYLEVKDGKKTGKLIQKYDWDRFYADKKAWFNYHIKKYGKNSQSYVNAARAWYKDNEIRNITDEDFNALVRRKQEELSSSEFSDWKRRNIRETDEGEIRLLVGDSLLSVPTDKYLNKDWIAIKDDLLYQKFVQIIDKYTDYFGKATILNKGFIPTMSDKEKENLNAIDKLKQLWIAVNKHREQSESFVGENNEMVYLLTVPMVNYFSQEEEIKIDYKHKDESEAEYERRIIQNVAAAGRGNFKTLGEIYAKNKEIRKVNDEYHAGKINYNLYNVFAGFIKQANVYKAKAEMKHEYDLMLYQLRNMKFNKRNAKKQLLKNKAASKAVGKDVTGEESGQGTNLEQHVIEWLEAVFYGNFDIDEGTLTTIGNMLIKFTSAKNMWFNMTAGINNVMIGKIQAKLESFAGWYFEGKNIRKADKMYMAAVPDMIANLGSTKSGTLVNAIIKKLNITQNTNERDYTTGMLRENLMSWSSAYFLNDIGEHYLQNLSLLSMMDHSRIIDGKIVSFAEFKTNNYEKALRSILTTEDSEKLDAYLKARRASEEFIEAKHDYFRDFILNLPIEKGNAFVAAKKKLDATSREEFEANPKLIDAFTLNENGYAEIRDEYEIDGKKYSTKLNANELALFTSKALHVVQKQQGIYNKEDAATISRTVLGKMGMQFKKHVRPGWNKRFGTKFWKSYWAEARDEWNKGSFVSLAKFLYSPIARHKHFDNDEAKQFRSMMGRILNDLNHFATNIGLYWHTLDDFEKANVRRAILDQIYLATVFTVALLLKKLKPEDDDDEMYAYDLTVYEIDKLLSEVMMYSPWGVINETTKMLKSPAAVQSTLIDTYKLLSNIVGYPFMPEEKRVYQTGIYQGDSKIKVNAMKLVPIINKVQQLQRIDKYNKYYILFRG